MPKHLDTRSQHATDCRKIYALPTDLQAKVLRTFMKNFRDPQFFLTVITGDKTKVGTEGEEIRYRHHESRIITG
jgi:hypothetical protein